uniref:Uncharacterized protein n=1 Tax=Panagrolaimus sp. ES5 TaxID=591445 RepID=A0AC34FU44_9BILA
MAQWFTTYINVGESALMEFIYLFGLAVMLNALKTYLKLSKFKKDLSPFLMTHMIIWIIAIIFAILHNTYVMIGWRPSEPTYNAMFYYVTCGLNLATMALPPVTVLFLSAERCIILIFPFIALRRIRLMLMFCHHFICCIVLGVTTWSFWVSAPTPFPLETHVLFASVLSLNGQTGNDTTTIRIVLSSANLVMAGILILAYFRSKFTKQNTTNTNRITAELIKRTLVVQTLSDLFLNALAAIIVALTGEPATTYLGAFNRFLVSFDSVVCAMILLKCIKKMFAETNLMNPSSVSATQMTQGMFPPGHRSGPK